MKKKLPRNVVAFSAVSFLNDVSSEMIYPLLPRFLTETLGAGAATVGGIEGAAQAVASLLKLASGWWSDKVRRRKPIVVAGYALAVVVRPLAAVATAASQVLAIRLADRVGKGVRESARDALFADSIGEGERGRAFGLQRACDNAGATLGPLIAAGLMSAAVGLSMRSVFWLAAVPGVLGVAALVVFVRDTPRAAPAEPQAPGRARINGRLARFLGVLFVFTLGNSTDAFLLLRAGQLGVDAWLLPVLWAVHNGSKALSSVPGGALSDRVGRGPLIVGGWLCYAATYFGFAHATEPWHAWALFAGYGLFYGMTEGTEKALVADLAPAGRRGAAYGWYNLTVGIAALPASLLFGLVWERWGAPAAFTAGAALALAATVALVALVRPPARPPAAA